ncbi:Rv2175c family DNA-binding protein [Georgenia sunbinii]|uniref:Rv2175c family DNA-binding protein n=1 Tax=Georgenia sunbinii TaxID=3117728 RepID=UPI002F26576C
MTSDDTSSTGWLSLPEVAEAMGIKLRDVRNLLRDNVLAGMRQPPPDGPFLVPASFLVDGDDPLSVHKRALASLRGTVIQLQDSGFTVDEAVHWLLSEEPALGTTPIQALRDKRIHEVRRVAQTL